MEQTQQSDERMERMRPKDEYAMSPDISIQLPFALG